MSDSITPTSTPDLHAPTAQIVAGFVSNNAVEADALPGLIHSVFQALSRLGAPEVAPAEAPRPEPAVPIKKSVFPDHIICLEDGKSFKAMKRHLQNTFGMTPDQYRRRWGLPPEYPMVAPAYAEQRSALAKSFGLGRSKGVAAAPAEEAKAAPAAAQKKRGRKPASDAAE